MKQVTKLGIAQAHLGDARFWHSKGDDFRMWRSLLLMAEVSWAAPSSARQIEQRKLASQLRQLTGCIGNLRALRSLGPWDWYIERVITDLKFVENYLRNQMKTISQRIPK